MKNKLLTKINDNSATIGIIGLGYVGLPLVIRFVEENFKVIGFDIDSAKCSTLNSGKSYIRHIPTESIQLALKNGFTATTNWSKIAEVDCMLICVPTPLGANNTPDLQYIQNTLNSIQGFLKKGQLLILESTTYPGTTEEEIVPEVEKNNFKIGTDFFIAYSPEREDPGNPDFSTQTIPKVVSGHTQNCCEVANSLYQCIVDKTVTVSSTKTAEMTKLLENIYRAVNIGLVNELKMVADKMDIDIFEVIETAATKPFGFTPFYPGPGLGGHCIPIDPFYLTWKAKQVGVTTRFIELAGEVNTNMPKWVLEKAAIGLRSRGLKISESKVLILGMAYKKNVDDLRESPSLELINLLSEMGVDADYHDFYIHKLHRTRKHSFDKSSINLEESIGNYDLVILATDHDQYDYEFLQKNSKLIVDTCGPFKRNQSNIISA
mgnify:FL=1